MFLKGVSGLRLGLSGLGFRDGDLLGLNVGGSISPVEPEVTLNPKP